MQPTHIGHGAMPGTKNMPDLGLNSESGNAIRPYFHFRIYAYIRLIVTKLGIFEGVTSHSHMITNINCKCSLNMYLAHYSTDLLHSTCKKIGCNRGTCNKEEHKAGGVRKGAGRKKRMQSVESQNLGSFSMNQILLALQKHMSITHIQNIPDVLQTKCNFNGQVHDPRTTEE